MQQNKGTLNESQLLAEKIIKLLTEQRKNSYDFGLRDNVLEYLHNGNDLTYDEILTVACKIYNVDRSIFFMKPDQNKRDEIIRQNAFFFCCKIFNNGNDKDFYQFIGRRAWNFINAVRDTCRWTHNNNYDRESEKIYSLFYELMNKERHRIANVFEKMEKDLTLPEGYFWVTCSATSAVLNDLSHREGIYEGKRYRASGMAVSNPKTCSGLHYILVDFPKYSFPASFFYES